jgi:FKBP-type peptidyl-prolyl cis-trans isomerase SlyD
VQDNQIVTMSYELKVDGGVVDKSDEAEPIQFLQGAGNIIPGLERQLYGMKIGETRTVVVAPAEGYGEVDESGYLTIPRAEFPSDIPLETGLALQVRTEDDEEMDAYIVEINDDAVRLNLNHPLAGKELHFTVKVLALRPATDEEVAHGHIHGADWEAGVDEEEWEDEEDWDEEDDEDWDDDEEEEDDEL